MTDQVKPQAPLIHPVNSQSSGLASSLSPEQYQLAIETAGEAVVVIQDEQVKFCNVQTVELTGYSLSDLMSLPLVRLLHPTDHNQVLAFHRRRMKGEGVPPVYSFRIVSKNGAIRWVENRAVVIHWEGRLASLHFLTDITERRQVEEALHASENTLRAIFNSVYDAIFIHDLDGTIIDVNDKMLEMYGVERNIATTLSFARDYSAPDNPLEDLPRIWQKVKAGENQFFEWKARRPVDGVIFDVEVFLGRLPMEDRDLIMATVRDITARKQAEAEIRKLSQFREIIIDNANVLVAVLDQAGNLVIWNKAAERITGYTRAEVLGRSQVWQQAIQDENQRQQVLQTLNSGQAVEDQQLTIRTKHGGQKTVSLYIRPLVDEQGMPAGVVAVAFEITERKQAEEGLRQYAAELQARNDDLDAFAHAVAHDLKNPLNVLTNMADILAADRTGIPPEAMQNYLLAIARSGRKAMAIVESLLLLAGVRQQEVPLVRLDMLSIVHEARQQLVSLTKESQAEVIIMPGEWPAAQGYAPWVEEVWVNYLSNALKYGGHPPRLELGATPEPDGMVRFWVRDNGPGLSPADQNRLFRPFTQLEPGRAEGHGLGLSIVRRIVEKLGGQVSVESVEPPGHGSVFSFTLPAANQ